MSKTTEQRIVRLEEEVKSLRAWRLERECEMHLMMMGHRITNHLLKLGASKVDLDLIASLNSALGIDIMPLTDKAPKAVRKYAKRGIKSKRP